MLNLKASHVNARRQARTSILQGFPRLLLQLKRQKILTDAVESRHIVGRLSLMILCTDIRSHFIHQHLDQFHAGRLRGRRGTMQQRVSPSIDHIQRGPGLMQKLSGQIHESMGTGHVQRDLLFTLVHNDPATGQFRGQLHGFILFAALAAVDKARSGARRWRGNRRRDFVKLGRRPRKHDQSVFVCDLTECLAVGTKCMSSLASHSTLTNQTSLVALTSLILARACTIKMVKEGKLVYEPYET